MDWEEIIQIICVMLTGAATAIPLVLKLVEYVKKSVQERNWKKLLDLTMDLMEGAEGLFAEGAMKKAYVVTAVDNLADSIGYDVDADELGALIDKLCALSKKVNVG